MKDNQKDGNFVFAEAMIRTRLNAHKFQSFDGSEQEILLLKGSQFFSAVYMICEFRRGSFLDNALEGLQNNKSVQKVFKKKKKVDLLVP